MNVPFKICASFHALTAFDLLAQLEKKPRFNRRTNIKKQLEPKKNLLKNTSNNCVSFQILLFGNCYAEFAWNIAFLMQK